jgi:hypothetical protein
MIRAKTSRFDKYNKQAKDNKPASLDERLIALKRQATAITYTVRDSHIKHALEDLAASVGQLQDDLRKGKVVASGNLAVESLINALEPRYNKGE